MPLSSREFVTIGGAFFQIDLDQEDFQNSHPDEKNVQILHTIFEANHAVRAGGGYFIDTIEALYTDCSLTAATDLQDDDYRSADFNCSSMRENTVGEEGYGPTVATAVTDFHVNLILSDQVRLKLNPGGDHSFLNWKSGDKLPDMEFVVLDYFHQGPGLTNTRCAAPGEHSQNLLDEYEGYAKATVDAASVPRLIPNALITDVANGSGIVSVGRPLSRPGDYALALWIADNVDEVVTIHITVRACIINEHSTLNGTLCSVCDSNQYNFDPESENCTLCHADADCASNYTLPRPGHWNAFPCAPNIEKCINEDACKNANATELMERVQMPISCNFTQELMDWYAESLCEDGYSGPLCGSCADSTGRVGLHTCRACLATVINLSMILAAVFIVMSIVILQIKGNLDTTVHWALKRTCSTLRLRSTQSLGLPGSRHILDTQHSDQCTSNNVTKKMTRLKSNVFRQKENLAKWKFVELLKVPTPSRHEF